jgi:ADP-heptose:LPS heptosyltransferase
MKPLQRICVIAEGQLGDLLILSPAIRALKESFKGAALTVLVLQRRSYEEPAGALTPVLIENPKRGTSAVLRSDAHVDRVAEIDREALRNLGGVRRIRAEWSILRWFWKGRFDGVICTFPQDRFFLWAYISGARVRVGEEGKKLSVLLSCRVKRKSSGEGVLAHYCALAEAAGASVRTRRTSVVIPLGHRERAEARWISLGLSEERAVVAVHPGASGHYRIWPPESFAALIDHLQQKRVPVILTGSMFDRQVLEEVRKKCATTPRLVFTTEVMDLAALLAKCVLCISNNSGPRHLAVAAGVPSLALIPRFDDVLWKIYGDEKRAGTMQSAEKCPACPVTACRNTIPPGEVYGSWCMRALSVEEVSARVDYLLGLAPAETNAPA